MLKRYRLVVFLCGALLVGILTGYLLKKFDVLGRLTIGIKENYSSPRKITNQEKALYGVFQNGRTEAAEPFNYSFGASRYVGREFFDADRRFSKDYAWAIEFFDANRTQHTCSLSVFETLGIDKDVFQNLTITETQSDDNMQVATLSNGLKFHYVLEKAKNQAKTLVIFLHGHSTNPTRLFGGKRDYLNFAGKVLNENGFDVVAPYTLAHAWGNTVVSEYGLLTGSPSTSFTLDLMKIRGLHNYFKNRYDYVVLYGVSRGGYVAQFYAMAFGADINLLVLSGTVYDNHEYLMNQLDFKAPQTGHESFIASAASRGCAAQLLRVEQGLKFYAPRPLVLEFSTHVPLIQTERIIGDIRRSYEGHGKCLHYSYFEGFHETNPEATVPLIKELLGDKTESCLQSTKKAH